MLKWGSSSLQAAVREGGDYPVVVLLAPERDAAPSWTPERLSLAHEGSGSLEYLRARADQDEVGVRGRVLQARLFEGRLEALAFLLYEARPSGDGLCLAHRGFCRGLGHQAHAERDVRAPSILGDLGRRDAVADPQPCEPVDLGEGPGRDDVVRLQDELVRARVQRVVDELVVGL